MEPKQQEAKKPQKEEKPQKEVKLLLQKPTKQKRESENLKL